jgi:hypothetical protein
LRAPALRAKGATFKAAKPDDAEADVKEWKDELLREMPIWKVLGEERLARVCDGLRSKAVSFWQRNLRREASEFLDAKFGPNWRVSLSSKDPELEADRSAVANCMRRVAWCDYWDWSAGSTLFFWRWTKEFQHRARDGVPVHLRPEQLPRYLRPQPVPKDPEKIPKVRKKLAKIRDRNYIEKGKVSSLTGYFDVPKAGMDIRMVYDASESAV